VNYRTRNLIVYLNNSNKILSKSQLSKGGITGTLVDIRLVFKMALEMGATGLILCHNHPSGTLVPSDADKQITKKLRTAGDSLEIKVLDHLIVTSLVILVLLTKEYFKNKYNENYEYKRCLLT
jgi:DNA repair protein RadC